MAQCGGITIAWKHSAFVGRAHNEKASERLGNGIRWHDYWLSVQCQLDLSLRENLTREWMAGTGQSAVPSGLTSFLPRNPQR